MPAPSSSASIHWPRWRRIPALLITRRSSAFSFRAATTAMAPSSLQIPIPTTPSSARAPARLASLILSPSCCPSPSTPRRVAAPSPSTLTSAAFRTCSTLVVPPSSRTPEHSSRRPAKPRSTPTPFPFLRLSSLTSIKPLRGKPSLRTAAAPNTSAGAALSPTSSRA